MKKLVAFLLAAVMVIAMSVTVFAAPSPGPDIDDDDDQVITVEGVTPNGSKVEVDIIIKEDNVIVIPAIRGDVTGGEVTFQVPDVQPGTTVIVQMWDEKTGSWIEVPATVGDDGTITIVVSGGGNNGKPDKPADITKAPQTGESSVVAILVAVMAVAGCAAVIAKRRFA